MRKLKFSKSSIRNMGGIREEIKQLAHRVMSKSIHDFGIPRDGGKRTAKRQNVLYKLVPRVTWLDGYMKKSYHQSGEALDIFIYDQHGACWACKDKYKYLSDLFKAEFDLMKEEGIFGKHEFLRWGGDWKMKDLPHFEVRVLR